MNFEYLFKVYFAALRSKNPVQYARQNIKGDDIFIKQKLNEIRTWIKRNLVRVDGKIKAVIYKGDKAFLDKECTTPAKVWMFMDAPNFMPVKKTNYKSTKELILA